MDRIKPFFYDVSCKQMNSEKNFGLEWKDEQEVLDAVKESERIRENIYNTKSIIEGDTPIKKVKVKIMEGFDLFV